MGSIRVLSERIINKIAAGEVVERPASVVKELVENALDAGATQVFITLANGGKDNIAVLDNGSGMEASDARLAVQRHATSKIIDEQGLESISTLGFRGEALASIAAVSRFELLTCGSEDAGGIRIALEGGGELSCGRAAFPRGSKITVQDLFFNTPVRRKFLRATSTELQHIQTYFTQAALAFPEVHFRLTHNQRDLHNLTPCRELGDRCFQLFGEAFAEGMVPVEGREGMVAFEGLLSFPSDSKSSRRWQYLFINGRPIRNPGLNHGIYQAYRTLLMKDRHPAYVLKLILEHGEVDVNVHPAKSEVRLSNPQLVHSVLADRLHRALMDASRRRAFGAQRDSAPMAGPAMATHMHDSPLGGQGELALAGTTPSHGPTTGITWPQVGPRPSHAGRAADSGADPEAAPGDKSTPESPPGAVPFDGTLIPGGGAFLQANPFQGEGFHFNPLSGPLPSADAPGLELSGELSVLGQLHTTYLLVQRQGHLLIVDQHAAHERILFEQYRRQFYEGRPVTERYLLPLTMEMSAQNGLLLEQYLPQWNRMGFEIEPFGRSTYLVRQVPAILSGKDVEALILEVLDDLALFGKSGRVEEVINEILERVACHSAIRAGMRLSREEMESLLAQLEQLDINLYCPHGRPVWVELPLQELEKRFKRIV